MGFTHFITLLTLGKSRIPSQATKTREKLIYPLGTLSHIHVSKRVNEPISESATMVYPTIDAAVAKVVYDTQVKTINEFKAFLESKNVDVSDMESEFTEFLSTFKVAAVAEKKVKQKVEPTTKKQPTLFNLFVKDKMATLKAENPDKKGNEILSLASEAWKLDTFALFVKENQAALKEKNPNLNNEMLYKKAKESYESSDKSSDD